MDDIEDEIAIVSKEQYVMFLRDIFMAVFILSICKLMISDCDRPSLGSVIENDYTALVLTKH